ncbi:MAG: carboxy terminal-processing peptidase [bacterium]|nr:carboxy terminal-processing peptidase [bacterium]
MKAPVQILASALTAFFLVVSTLAAAPASDNDEERTRILSRVLRQHLTRLHFVRKNFNDQLSSEAFGLFLEQVDGQKRFLTEPDVQKLRLYETRIDNEMMTGRIELPEVCARLMRARVEKVEKMVEELLNGGFHPGQNEELETDPQKRLFCASDQELKERWRLLLKYSILLNYVSLAKEKKDEQALAGEKLDPVLWSAALEQTRKSCRSMFSRMKKQDMHAFRMSYLNAVVRTFDPHTNYMDPSTEEEFDIHMKGSLEGIGASLREDDSYIKVVEIIPGSAAARQGQLAKEDIILKVAQETGEPVDLSEMRLQDAVKLIRGPKGTEVRLFVKKPNGDMVTIPIVRDVVNIEETFVKGALLHENRPENRSFGYIKIPSFYRDLSASGFSREGRNVSDDFHAALEELKQKGMEGLIVDLRDNGGGALQDTINITGMFIEGGPVVQIKNYRGQIRPMYSFEEEAEFTGPVVVLVNKFSASASEILAAALQDYGRAIIIGGDHTHGKGTVQTLIDLDQSVLTRNVGRYGPFGALKLTVQKFYRINGDSTQYRGVIPDIILPDRLSPLETGERYLKYSLPWDRIEPVSYAQWSLRPNLGELQRESLERVRRSAAFAAISKEVSLEKEKIANTRRSLNLKTMLKEMKEAEQLEKEPVPCYDYTVQEAGTIDTQRDEKQRLPYQLVRDPYVQEAFFVLESLTVQ